MDGFEVDGMSPGRFVAGVRAELEERDLGGLADIGLDGSDLVFRVRWMGSSELRYRLSAGDNGFAARLVDEKISPFHAPFRQKFIERFDQVIEAVGARSA